MADEHTKTILIGNDKGGVGKDLVAEGIATVLEQMQQPFRLIEVEIGPRLELLYPDTVFIGAPATTIEEIYDQPDVLFERFDRLLAALGEKPINVVSLGANLTGAFLQWARNDGAEQMLSVTDPTMCVVLTMNNAALTTGVDNLKAFGELFPDERRVAVLNEYAADFVTGDKYVNKLLRDARGEGAKIETTKLPRMTAPAWGHIQNLGALSAVMGMDAAALVERGLPEGVSKRSMISFRGWFEKKYLPAMKKILP